MLELGLFYIAATVSLISTVLAVTRYNAAHALIYLIISLLASAIIFYLVGAPFAAVLEVVIYAGAIMVLFVFVIMLTASSNLHEYFGLHRHLFSYSTLIQTRFSKKT